MLSMLSMLGCSFDAPFTAPDGDSPGDGPDMPDVPDGGAVAEAACPIAIDPDADRPLELMPRDRLAQFAQRMPVLADCAVRDLIESPDTVFYDRLSIIPGYQDSFGDNVVAPIGMRPNTIRSSLIDTAVPGGHAQIFAEPGIFHFPFGRDGAISDTTFIVDFWNIPRDQSGALLPVVYWSREPSELTHRIEWMFPAGTVLGEIIFIADPAGQWVPFEIRTRRRLRDSWTVDVLRPFPTAADLGAALEARRDQWASPAAAEALLAHLADGATLVPASLGATHFDGAFPTVELAADRLPDLADQALVTALLLETPYRSARGEVWRSSGALHTYAATTSAAYHVVPAGYDGGFLAVDDQSCNRCHENAGRPLGHYYDNITAYGELWGGDNVFSWHPFDPSFFVDESGDVVNFNYDNRRMRPEMVEAQVLAPYDPALHPAELYSVIPGDWKDYAY